MATKQLNPILPIAIIFCVALLSACLIYLAAFYDRSPSKFTVNSLISSKTDSSITAFSQIDLRLSSEVTEAINNGVPIYILVQHGFPKNSFFKTTVRQKQQHKFRLERHALSDKYILSALDDNQLQNFDSISSALTYLGQSFKMVLNTTTKQDKVAIRAYVDLKQLPSALRLRHFFSNDWRHDSGWSIWPLKS